MSTSKRTTFILLLAVIYAAAAVVSVSADNVYAYSSDDDPAALVLGAKAFARDMNTANAPVVYFGMKGDKDAYAWKVIGYEDNERSVASSPGTLTLFASEILGTTEFNKKGVSNTEQYGISDLKKSIDQIELKLSDIERRAIVPRTLASGSYDGRYTDCIAGDEVSDALLWPLSTKEAYALDEALLDPASETEWWLRSQGSSDDYWYPNHCKAAGVGYDTLQHFFSIEHDGMMVYMSKGVRPAFNIHSGSILFATEAKNFKYLHTAFLSEVGKNTTGEWKLTLLDDGSKYAVGDGHKEFKIDSAALEGSEIQLHYSGARCGEKEKISMIVVNNDQVSQYGIIQDSSRNSNGSCFINYKHRVKGDRLYLFNETVNSDKSENTAVMTDLSSAMKMVTIPELAWSGSGREEDPYIISDEVGWDLLSEYIESGYKTAGQFFKLENDIEVSSMVGTELNPFSGVFDGNGHTITFNVDDAPDACAPFRFVKDARIEGLNVTGTIRTSQKFAAGFVAVAAGAVEIEDCRSSVVIDSSVDGDGTHGGFIGKMVNVDITGIGADDAAVKLTGCIFDGSMLGEKTTLCGGFVGWAAPKDADDRACKLVHCVFVPSKITLKSGLSTFLRNSSSDKALTDCFWVKTLDRPQSKQVQTVEADSGILFLEEAWTQYDNLKVKFVKDKGFMYDGKCYYTKDSELNFKVDSECDGCSVSPETAVFTGKHPQYTLTVPNQDVKINIIKDKYHEWQFDKFSWTGNEKDGYTAVTADYKCKKDGDHKKSINTELTEETSEPTCTDVGKTTYKANIAADKSFDGIAHTESKDAKETSALGHSFTKYVSNEDATCTEDGTKTAKCDRCDAVDTVKDTGSAKGHSFTKYVSNDDATCTEDGTKTAKCDRCDAVDTVKDTGSAKGHEWIEATCTEPKTCSHCHMTEGQPTGHTWKAATCIAPKTCSICGTTEGEPDTDAHDWGDWQVTTEPAPDKNGVRTRVCRLDPSHKETERITASGKLLTKMKSKGKTSLVITWTKMKDAAGYEIYFARCNHKKKKNVCKKIADVEAGKKLKYTKKKLKKQASYKAFVIAYTLVDGVKVYNDTSLTMHAYTSGGNKKYINPSGVTVKKSKFSLVSGQTAKIKGKVLRPKKSKKKISNHAPALRYISSMKDVATVNKKGKIKARKKGSCKIYVIAVNGIRKKISVTVK